MLEDFRHRAADNLAIDHGGALVYLAPSRVNLQLAMEKWPKVRFDATREHAPVGRGKADIIQQLFHDRVQAAGADILDRFIDRKGDGGDFVDGVITEINGDVFSPDQGLVLADQAGIGFGQDAAEIFLGQGVQLDTDRQPPLKLGQQIRWLCIMECARSNEQNMVGFNRTVLGVHGRALD